MKDWKQALIGISTLLLVACATSEPEVEPEAKSSDTAYVEFESDEKIEEVAELDDESHPEEEEVAAAVQPAPAKTADGKIILGSEEWLYFPRFKSSIKVQVDDAVTTSLLSAVEIKKFERDGSPWVKFRAAHKDQLTKELSLPVVRWVNVQDASDKEASKQPVVVIWIQIGEIKEKTEFTLLDRSQAKFPVLIGKSFVRDVAVFNPKRQYVQPKVQP